MPAGRCVLDGYSPPFNELSVERPLLVDLYEVTRGEAARLLGGEEVPLEEARLPAVLGFDEAQELARRRGMRLPTAREWLYCAMGPRAHPYPWGVVSQASVANTSELDLRRPSAVGTFEAGRGPFGCYDQLGNVWEWVADRVPGRGDPPGEPGSASAVSVLGGSYLYRAEPLYRLPAEVAARTPVFNALSLAPGTRSADVGARLCGEAEELLWRLTGELRAASGHRARLEAVGRRFGPEAQPLLARLAARPEAPSALRFLLAGASP